MMLASLTPETNRDRQIRIAPADGEEAVDTVHPRHLQIEQQQIDRPLQRQLVHRRLQAAGLQRSYLRIEQLQEEADALAKQRMVVGVQNLHGAVDAVGASTTLTWHWRRRRGAWRCGSFASVTTAGSAKKNSLPPSAPALTPTVPPSLATMRCTVASPRPWPAARS